jgi:acetolactate synthase I/II/III large subunit
MKRVADVVADILTANKIEHVFMVTGGGAMHLNDALGGHPDLKYVSCHHEQTCSMAADAYFRLNRKLACVNVTTGPGGTNAITGVFGAWTDSIGMVVISGQVKWETLVRNYDLPLRQLGDQEVDIIKMVESITKYSVIIKDPKTIKYHLEKAIYLASNGRPGPVWIDIPIDIQASLVNPEELISFDPIKEGFVNSRNNLSRVVEEVLEKISKAERPVIMVGGGIRASGTHSEFIDFAERLGVPVVTCWNAHDVMHDDHKLYAGRPGSIGTRSGNFTVQNSDCVLILGSRLNIRQISYNYKSFARAAFKIMVDVDEAELKKPTLSIDLPVNADLNDFFREANKLSIKTNPTHESWLNWCKIRLAKYPACLPEYWQNNKTVNPYCFVDTLFSKLKESDIVVTGDGTACVVTFQAAKIKKNQRLFTNSGCASMGFDIPAAIGAHFASNNERLICIAGDGSIQMNLQDLQTLVTYKIPVTIFVLNNKGYHSIRQTQHSFFKGHVVGCGEESGLNFPEMEKIAYAYGIPFFRIENHGQLINSLDHVLEENKLKICEIMLDLDQAFSPKLSSRKLPDGKMVTSPLEDMAPFLDRSELLENMIITILEN